MGPKATKLAAPLEIKPVHSLSADGCGRVADHEHGSPARPSTPRPCYDVQPGISLDVMDETGAGRRLGLPQEERLGDSLFCHLSVSSLAGG